MELSGGCDPGVASSAPRVFEELAREEAQFGATLEAGEKVLRRVLGAAGPGGAVSGADAFLLYDTFGFPLEVTLEVAAEEGVSVDEAGFETAMEEQRRRSKDAFKAIDLTADGALAAVAAAARGGGSTFVGYEGLSSRGTVLALLRGGELVEAAYEGEEVDVVLNQTPFYAESGGQTGDVGELRAAADASGGGSGGGGGAAVVAVRGVTKAAGGALSVHRGVVASGGLAVGANVAARVDPGARHRACCNHTATHLLQAALKQVLGDDTSQQVRRSRGDWGRWLAAARFQSVFC